MSSRFELSSRALVMSIATAVGVSGAWAQDTADSAADQEHLDLEFVDDFGIDESDVVTSVAERELPAGVVRVRTDDGQYLPPFELQQACSGDWCGEVVINAQSGEVLFAQGRWQPGALETGYGQEVVVAVEQ